MQQPAALTEGAQGLEHRLNWRAIENLVLLRLQYGAAEGETEVQLRKDLHSLVMQDMSAGDWRNVLGQVILRLVDTGIMRPVRANAYMCTERSTARLLDYLKCSRLPKAAWHEIRDGYLTALALGLTPTARLVARLITAEGLRFAILTRNYGLPFDIATTTIEQLRFGLAKIAEQRGLTVGIRDTLIKENNLSQKEAVMMGTKLLKSRHVVESDGELIACLAAESVGAMNESAAELRQMLFRRLIDARESSELPDSSQGELGVLPDLAEFTEEVKAIAAEIAVGWPGNRRAFISHVWQALQLKFPHWPLNEGQYKDMILSAHRHGLLRLAIADLRDKGILDDVTSSRIVYKNSEWHFIRVEDAND
ncbi:MAG: hypothetical protein DHS20C08_17690 [Rhodomicrobium sp.]|nr:MAG: hypothetical protein DHS20C08_17690 [Rhodomicrobium sp.]